jgi:hypothetical protein
MKRVVWLLVLSGVLAFGAHEKKGQKYYLQRCASCHGSGKMWGNVATKDEWREFLTKNISELKSFHLKNPKVIEYLDSKDFQKEKNRMLRFLQEFASDSESIPSCNN